MEKMVLGEESLLYVRKRLEEATEKGENEGLTMDDLDGDHRYCICGAYPVKMALDNSEMPNKESVDPEELVLMGNFTTDEYKEGARLEFKYLPRADFNFLLSSTVRHDGTLLFEMQGIMNAFNKLINGEFIPKFEGDKEFFEHPAGRKLHYDYGDFVIINTFGEGPKDKPWMCAKTHIFLPIRIEIQERKEDE